MDVCASCHALVMMCLQPRLSSLHASARGACKAGSTRCMPVHGFQRLGPGTCPLPALMHLEDDRGLGAGTVRSPPRLHPLSVHAFTAKRCMRSQAALRLTEEQRAKLVSVTARFKGQRGTLCQQRAGIYERLHRPCEHEGSSSEECIGEFLRVRAGSLSLRPLCVSCASSASPPSRFVPPSRCFKRPCSCHSQSHLAPDWNSARPPSPEQRRASAAQMGAVCAHARAVRVVMC